jgi:hypothetical protein
LVPAHPWQAINEVDKINHLRSLDERQVIRHSTSSAGKYTEEKKCKVAEKNSRSIVLRVYLVCAEDRVLRKNSKDSRRNRQAAQRRLPTRIADAGDGGWSRQ